MAVEVVNAKKKKKETKREVTKRDRRTGRGRLRRISAGHESFAVTPALISQPGGTICLKARFWATWSGAEAGAGAPSRSRKWGRGLARLKPLRWGGHTPAPAEQAE